MIRLFHGSYIAVPTPLVKLGRKKVDFGQGFYLTKLREQATSWAITIAERKGRYAQPFLTVYKFDDTALLDAGYRIKRFESYDMEWLNYVIDCRKGGVMQQQYDIVEGGVANDKVIDTVEDYENGIITAEQALGQLKYKEINHQICILSQDVADKYLSFAAAEKSSRREGYERFCVMAQAEPHYYKTGGIVTD